MVVNGMGGLRLVVVGGVDVRWDAFCRSSNKQQPASQEERASSNHKGDELGSRHQPTSHD